jgi:hypothetical protein
LTQIVDIWSDNNDRGRSYEIREVDDLRKLTKRSNLGTGNQIKVMIERNVNRKTLLRSSNSIEDALY